MATVTKLFNILYLKPRTMIGALLIASLLSSAHSAMAQSDGAAGQTRQTRPVDDRNFVAHNVVYPSILEVIPGSVAERAGLRNGDQFILYNGKCVGVNKDAGMQFQEVVKSGAGRSVAVVIVRKGQLMRGTICVPKSTLLGIEIDMEPLQPIAQLQVCTGTSVSSHDRFASATSGLKRAATIDRLRRNTDSASTDRQALKDELARSAESESDVDDSPSESDATSNDAAVTSNEPAAEPVNEPIVEPPVETPGGEGNEELFDQFFEIIVDAL